MKRVFGVLVITILALSVIPIGFGQSGFTYPPNYDPEKGDDLNFDLNDYYYDVYTNTMKDLKCYRSCKSENGQCIDNCQKAEENNKVICDKIESDCTDLYSGDNWDADEYNMCLKANGYNDCTERTVYWRDCMDVKCATDCDEKCSISNWIKDQCTDSDGKSYFEKGTVDVVDSSGNIVTSKEDSCEGDILLEQYCENNERKEEVYNCNVDDSKCIEGACTQIKFESPVSLKLLNPPYNILMDPVKGQYIGQASNSDSKAVLMAHPKIFSERKIIDYNKERTFYRRDEWNIVTEYDPLIAFANVYVYDKDKEVSAKFSLQGETKAGECKRIGDNPDTEGYLTWLCSAEFDAQTGKRGEKMNVKVTASVDDKKIETTTNDIVIARFVYPVTRVRGPPNIVTTSKGEKYQEDQTIEWGNIVQQVDYFIKLSDLAKTGIEMLENPKKSYKFVYYHAGDKPVELRKDDVYEEVGKEKVIKENIGSVVARKLGFQNYYNAEKDKVILVSDYIVDGSGKGVGGFTPNPSFKYIVLRPKIPKTTLAHEFGHAYKPYFCEEYSYVMWESQKSIQGCSNPFPRMCLNEITDLIKREFTIRETLNSQYINPILSVSFLVGEKLSKISGSYSLIKDDIEKLKESIINIDIDDFYCIKGTTIMGSDFGNPINYPITYEKYPEGGECPIGPC